jgi:MFS superfamily sulfate permease-like transporter
MEDKLRRYIDGLFARIAPTKKAVELKEEMLQNLHDKYSDLVSEGKTPEAAYNIAIAGIGDVSGLLSELEADIVYEMPDMAEYEASRRKSAMMTAIAVMLYILSIMPLIVLSEIGFRYPERIGVPVLFIMIAAATGLLVYNHMTKPKYHKTADTMVEDFREWRSGASDQKSLRRAISSALWSVLVVLYFIVSFWTFAWHLTWIIFIIGGAIEAIINILFTLKKS